MSGRKKRIMREFEWSLYFFCIFFLINCWSSVVASVVLPQFVQSSTFFFYHSFLGERSNVRSWKLQENGVGGLKRKLPS